MDIKTNSMVRCLYYTHWHTIYEDDNQIKDVF